MANIKVGDVAYVAVDQFQAKVLKKEKDAKRPWNRKEAWKKAALIWGDVVYVRKILGSRALVSAKGHLLDVPKRNLTDKAILNIWQIDCGQGDAALIRFPNGKWAAIDLGPSRHGFINSNSGRTAIDFIKWVAFEDNNWMFEGANKGAPFHFDWIVFTHPDEDHIGAGKEFTAKLGKWWSVGTVYHSGIGRFKGGQYKKFNALARSESERKGLSQLGEIDGESNDKLFISTVINDWNDIEEYQKMTSRRKWYLKGNYADILKQMLNESGKSVKNLQRLSHKSGGKDISGGDVKIKVLGPIEEKIPRSNKVGFRYFDENKTSGYYNLEKPSLSRNGHSVVLRLDYIDVRILMTGDLNFKSQALLLQNWENEEFKCHVAKACHHGSEDISWKFLKAMSPLATMFSSGDQETHVHPRALVLGLSGGFGPLMRWNKPKKNGNSEVVSETFNGFKEEKLFTPLLYSTELSRSVRLRTDMKAYIQEKRSDGTKIHKKADGIYLKGNKKDDKPLKLNQVRVVDKIKYGLINLRTDGKTIMMAVLEEGNSKTPKFHIEKFTPSELVEL